MKKLLSYCLITICLSLSHALHAQTLISENKVCIQVVYKLPSFTAVTEYLKIKGDTVINNLNYKKVFQSFDKNQKFWNNFGYIRETLDQKVYYREDSSKYDYLFYDFTVKLHDTIQLATISSFNNGSHLQHISFIVSNIDSVKLENQYRKRIHLGSINSPDINLYGEYIMEEIGSLSGLLYLDDGTNGGDNYNLICLLENDILIFHDEKFPTCYYKWPSTLIDNFKEDNELVEITFFDNGALQIHTLKNLLGELRLFNTNGELILERTIISPETQICLPHSGIFIYQFISEKNDVQTGKVMVK